MDATASHHLVLLSREQQTLVPVSSALVVDADQHPEPDLFDLLWQCFCQLARLFLLALIKLHRLRLQVTDLRIRANWYRSLHQRALQRAAKLAEEVKRLRGEIREWKHRFYGRKSETSYMMKTRPPVHQREKRSRGQQRGSKGHGRRDHQHLPTTTESCVLSKEQQCCRTCGEPFMEIPGSATGEILEIEVRAHRRRYERQRYRRH
jgi:hypothetical protein